MRVICGADGCKGGWIAISKDLDSGRVSWGLFATAHDLVGQSPAAQIVAIDTPIGLPERGERRCDVEARRMLGRGRGSSVFPAPIRPVLEAADADEASEIRFRIEGKKMARQAFGIVPKIREVDALLREEPLLRARVREVHPELCFFMMAGGQPIRQSKKTAQGSELRRGLLTPMFGESISEALAERRQLASTEDDVLDAFAALWTAERIVHGTCLVIPPNPPTDVFGLRMEIVV